MADVPNKPTDSGTPNPQSGGSGLGAVLGGLAGALGGGVAAAAGSDIFDKFMQTVNDLGGSGGMSDEQKNTMLGKIRLAALGYDTSGINDEFDLAAKEGQIAKQSEDYARKTAQLNEMVDAANMTTSGWREQETPVEADQIGGFLQTQDQIVTLRKKLNDVKPPGADLSTVDYRIGEVGRGYEEAKALSDARTAGTYATGGQWGQLAEMLTAPQYGPNTRAGAEARRNGPVSQQLAQAQAAHQAVSGLRRVGDGFVGPAEAVRLRMLLSDSEGMPLPWAEVQGNKELLEATLAAGADPKFGQNIEDAQTAYTAEVDEGDSRDLMAGFGIPTPDPTDNKYRTENNEFDRKRFYRDTFTPLVDGADKIPTRDLARLAVNMQSIVSGGQGDPATPIVADSLQRITGILIDRLEANPDDLDGMGEDSYEEAKASFDTFLLQSQEGGGLVRDMAEVFPAGISTTRGRGPLFRWGKFAGRPPQSYEERVQVLNDLQADMRAGNPVPPEQRDFFRAFSSMSPEAGFEYLTTGKAPEFDGGQVKRLFVQSIMPPGSPVTYGELRAKSLATYRVLSSANMPEAASAAEAQAKYYEEREYGRDVGTKSIRTVGLALQAFSETGDLNDVATRVMGDFSAAAERGIEGSAVITDVSLKNAKEELARAEGAGEKAKVLLRTTENWIYNASGLQFGTVGERATARGEAQVIFTRIREQLDSLIEYQEASGLTDAQMAKKLGGKGEDWVAPLFEAFGEVALGL